MKIEEFNEKEFIEFINKGTKCDNRCPCHKFVTHNACFTCAAIKDSPYQKDYIKDMTDEQIAKEVKEAIEDFC